MLYADAAYNLNQAMLNELNTAAADGAAGPAGRAGCRAKLREQQAQQQAAAQGQQAAAQHAAGPGHRAAERHGGRADERGR